MELWIRSQDRLRLAKMDSVIINARNKKEITSNYSYSSDGYEKDIPLGEYDTEERALEILDEIQKILEPLAKIELPYTGKILSVQELSTYVYEMPKE